LLKEAKLSHRKPLHSAAKINQTKQEAFTMNSKKRQEVDGTGPRIDQTKKSMQVESRIVWFPRGTRPSVELFKQRGWTCPLSTITEVLNQAPDFRYRPPRVQ
jgi:hypothetical protein